MITMRSPFLDSWIETKMPCNSANFPESSGCTGRWFERRPRSRWSISSNIARVRSSSKPESSLCVAERTRKGWLTRDCSFFIVPSTMRVIVEFSAKTFCASLDCKNAWYKQRWNSVARMKTLNIFLGGKNLAFKRFVRRKMNCAVTAEMCSSFSWPLRRSSGEAVGSRPRRIGCAKFLLKACRSPNTPGFATLTSVKNSSRLFWMGVPEMRSRRLASKPAMHRVTAASSFLSLCASSHTTMSHGRTAPACDGATGASTCCGASSSVSASSGSSSSRRLRLAAPAAGRRWP
mmetsp:Transcript_31796/g.96124  ORF Transcript_31796/g.96124 Transcript_31796/m.96124 type:complete len:290 (-) Transcript_31796:328-1197(-)